MINIFLKLLPYIRKMSFFEFLQGYRTYVAGATLIWAGVMGLLIGDIPIPTGGGINWVPLSPDIALGSLIAGLTALGLGGKLEKLTNKGDETMKKFAFVFLILLAYCVLAAPAFAWDFKLVDDWKAQETTGFVLKSGDASQLSGGAFYGPWAELTSDSGKRVLGFGGVTGNIKSDERGAWKGAIGMTVMTAFDDMLQGSIVIDPADFKWNEPDSYMFMIGISPIKAGSWTIDKGAALLGAILP